MWAMTGISKRAAALTVSVSQRMYSPSVSPRTGMATASANPSVPLPTSPRKMRAFGKLNGRNPNVAAASANAHSFVVVVLIPDSGRGYLSKLYDDKWLADFGFLRSVGHTVGDVLGRTGTVQGRAQSCGPGYGDLRLTVR